MGPTQVMRMEHVQMRALMDDAAAALANGDADDYLGLAETLLIMMQQHNMKEENILYPMCDQHLAAETPELLARLEAETAEP
jgi:hemerythrin-like domain-containing protein